MCVTSESVDGAVFKLHEGVERPPAADLSIWVGCYCGGCSGVGRSGGC